MIFRIFQTLALESEKRIVLAALYLGSGALERNFVQNIRKAILSKPQSLQLTGEFTGNRTTRFNSSTGNGKIYIIHQKRISIENHTAR